MQNRGGLPLASSLIGRELASFARFLLDLRAWERRNLPFFTPQIAVDVLLHCAASTLEEEFAAAKDFHLATGHSKDRVREIVQHLIDLGYICYIVDPRDARVRRATLTPKGVDVLRRYKHQLTVPQPQGSVLPDECAS